ncbi:MAG: hypothetical protein ACR2PR_08690 [Pseudohongiellaceae bacterium]
MTLQNITRYRNGLSDAPRNSFAHLVGLPVMDQTIGLSRFDDFTEYRAADWNDQSAGGGAALITSEPGGVLRHSGTIGQSTLLLGAGRPFQISEGQHLWFDARLRINLVTSVIECGIAADESTNDELVFRNETDGDLIFSTNENAAGAVVTQTGQTLPTSEFVRISFHIDAMSRISLFYNNTLLQRFASTLIPYDEPLRFILGGTNAAASYEVDYDYMSVVVDEGRPA